MLVIWEKWVRAEGGFEGGEWKYLLVTCEAGMKN